MGNGRMHDVAIVGAGASGLSAALVLGRARRDVVLFDDGKPRNASATEMHGFIGLDGASPQQLLERARRELQSYPSVALMTGTVASLAREDDAFAIELERGERFRARRTILATGMSDVLPEVPGLAEHWGRGVFVCPYCDGWEVRDRRLVAYGKADDAVGLAQELYRWSTSVVALACGGETSGPQRAWLAAAGVELHVAELAGVEGDGAHLTAVVPASGERIACDALFLSVDLRQSSDLGARLGCAFERNGAFRVDDRNRTTVSGVYAVGDAVTHFHQVIIAAASGARTAICVNDDLTVEDAARLAGSG